MPSAGSNTSIFIFCFSSGWALVYLRLMFASQIGRSSLCKYANIAPKRNVSSLGSRIAWIFWLCIL